MIVFHGSYIIVDKPSISFSRENLDFGKGFYVIELEEQAVSWASRYSKKDEKTYVSEYALEDDIYKISKVLRFDNYTEEWFDI